MLRQFQQRTLKTIAQRSRQQHQQQQSQQFTALIFNNNSNKVRFFSSSRIARDVPSTTSSSAASTTASTAATTTPIVKPPPAVEEINFEALREQSLEEVDSIFDSVIVRVATIFLCFSLTSFVYFNLFFSLFLFCFTCTKSYVSPAQWFEHIIEGIHNVTGFEWWGCIAVTTIAVRTLLLPIYLISAKNSARMQQMGPQLSTLQKKMVRLLITHSCALSVVFCRKIDLQYTYAPIFVVQTIFIFLNKFKQKNNAIHKNSTM